MVSFIDKDTVFTSAGYNMYATVPSTATMMHTRDSEAKTCNDITETKG